MEVNMKIGMLFPGYGSQFVGMGKELYDNSRIIQEYYEEASNCLSNNFVKLCFASSDIELSKITNAYPALFLVSVATAAAILQSDIAIDYVAGYGLGEYSALCCAGGLSFPDGLYLLSKLSQFYLQTRKDLDIRTIVVDGLSARKLEKICKEHSSHEHEAQIAVYENKTEHRVSGHVEAIDAVVETLSDVGADKTARVDLEEGMHTPLVAELVDQLKVYLTKVDFKDMKMPLITNVDAKPVTNAEEAQSAVIRQIVEPIHWHNVLKHFAHIDIIIIPAPSKALVQEVQAYYPDKKVIGIEQTSDIEALKELLTIERAISI